MRKAWEWIKKQFVKLAVALGLIGVASSFLGADPCGTVIGQVLNTTTSQMEDVVEPCPYPSVTQTDLDLSQKAAQWDAVKWQLSAEQREAVLAAKKAQYTDVNDKAALETKYEELIDETKK